MYYICTRSEARGWSFSSLARSLAFPHSPFALYIKRWRVRTVTVPNGNHNFRLDFAMLISRARLN